MKYQFKVMLRQDTSWKAIYLGTVLL